MPFFCFVLVENESHCDFTKLREMLIRTNMEDLRDATHARHYELYRKERLQQMGFSDETARQGSFAEQYAARRYTRYFFRRTIFTILYTF